MRRSVLDSRCSFAYAAINQFGGKQFCFELPELWEFQYEIERRVSVGED
uniref:Uncharacterized protein n=1 Tax=Rhizophora mucronata TaxID=61149 RepID=A0A2P2N7E0_RHIMU